MSAQLGIMGGTYDPIHDGHLVAAEEAAWTLGLDRVLFIPTFLPPHKGGPAAAVEHRVAMVRAAIADNPRFELSTMEVERQGKSFTLDTLQELHQRYPDTELHLIVGMDSLADLPTWHNPAGILQLAQVAAVHRAGWDRVALDDIVAKLPEAAGRVRIIDIPGLDIASSDMRARIAAGRPVRYLAPKAVLTYIDTHQLYRGDDPEWDRRRGADLTRVASA